MARPAFELWEAHAPALDAFQKVCGQWRTVPKGIAGTRYIGLDYAAVEAGFRLASVTLTTDEWDDFRWIEAGAAQELNRD
ncbi:DUF1799 domain-containing protein [Rhodobacter capsulatus]|uniref:DUF1799 domain-containing protein n=1 Tax=Rhodobacter capsulatus TaxID=1061 RepID=UPI0003D2B4AD|nr:DUF1799 domain-containing protein [Rhodobacter capsulatus]ETD85786.1 hypothetical protein U703_02520 [Rhodobacter capsulatus YW1]